MAERDDRRRKVTLALMAATLLTGITAFMKSFFWIGYWPHRVFGLATLILTVVHVRDHWRTVLRWTAETLGRSTGARW